MTEETCSHCGKSLFPHAVFEENIDGTNFYAVVFSCKDRRWYKPWHSEYAITHFNELWGKYRTLRFGPKQLKARYGIIVPGSE